MFFKLSTIQFCLQSFKNHFHLIKLQFPHTSHTFNLVFFWCHACSPSCTLLINIIDSKKKRFLPFHLVIWALTFWFSFSISLNEASVTKNEIIWSTSLSLAQFKAIHNLSIFIKHKLYQNYVILKLESLLNQTINWKYDSLLKSNWELDVIQFLLLLLLLLLLMFFFAVVVAFVVTSVSFKKLTQ